MNRLLLPILLMLSFGCSPSAPETTGPDPLQDLIGALGRDGEQQLTQAGFEHRSTKKTDTSAISYWRAADDRCVEVTTTDGRYAKIADVATSACDDDGSAVQPSGNAAAMRTVCGVIVGGQNHRYICEVEEDRQGVTTLAMPDTTVRLVWQPNGKLRFEQEQVDPVVATYSEAEGEVDIFVDERTFFYISNPEAAAAEVEHFQQ